MGDIGTGEVYQDLHCVHDARSLREDPSPSIGPSRSPDWYLLQLLLQVDRLFLALLLSDFRFKCSQDCSIRVGTHWSNYTELDSC